MKFLIAALALVLGATEPVVALTLTSRDFHPGGPMSLAQIYPECAGANRSPALDWDTPPPGTRSFALTLFDPDARPAGWWHWLVIDLPAPTRAIASGQVVAMSRQLSNDFANRRYDGPCPPTGSGIHHYRFTLWALPVAQAPVGDAATPAELENWLEQHAIGRAALTGTVQR